MDWTIFVCFLYVYPLFIFFYSYYSVVIACRSETSIQVLVFTPNKNTENIRHVIFLSDSFLTNLLTWNSVWKKTHLRIWIYNYCS